MDNGSYPPILPDALGELREVRVVREERPGSYAARNRGAKEATGDVFVFLDAGCLPRPDWFEKVLIAITTDSSCIWGGSIEIVPSFGQERSLVYLYERLFSFPQESYIRDLNFSVTANLVVSRQTFDNVGGFRDELYSAGDFEFGMRAKQRKVTVRFCRDAIVEHVARDGVAALFKKQRRILGGQFMLSRMGYDKGRIGYTTKALAVSLIRPPIRRLLRVLFGKCVIPLGYLERSKLVLLILALHYRGTLIRAGYMCRVFSFYPRA